MGNLEKHPDSEEELAVGVEENLVKPRSKAWDILQDSVTKFWTRQEILHLLRERHQLTIFECHNVAPEVVRARQTAYEADLALFKKKWDEEDAIDAKNDS